LKELHPHHASNPNTVHQFMQEAQITGQLEHPGIVPVYELIKPGAGRDPFYTMRFVRGRTLTEACIAYHERSQAGTATPLEFLTLLNAFVSVCQTVAYAHSRGIVHRDLKGSNVVLGDFGEVIVLDWGLAKRMADDPDGARRTSTDDDDRLRETWATHCSLPSLMGEIKGTPQYMAPEQAAGRADLIGRWTDVYGLGAILYHILTGRPPFNGPDVASVLRQVVADEPAPPSCLAPATPRGLEAACLRAMAKDPGRRHAAAGDLADEVRQWLAETAERSRDEQVRERFFNLSLDMLCTVGLDHRFKQLNPAWEKTLGWSREELIDRPYLDFVHPDDRESARAEEDRAAKGAAQPAFENRYLCKGGGFRWISWFANLIPGEGMIYAVGRDVTDRKRAEEALRRSEERFVLAVRGSGDGIWDWDIETNESYYSPRWKSMLGYDDHELTYDLEEWTSRLHPDDRAAAMAALNDYVEGRAPTYQIEYRLRHKDGTYRWILDRGEALRNAAGAYRMAGSHADITERKQMEQALRDSEERHRADMVTMAEQLTRCQDELNRLTAESQLDPPSCSSP